ncbi:two-component sensor histidine kinase [Virgisporangium aliadipatigenens]|uniref:histidine kinase n=1 Tax=Virgisporangium aliadipatigenens TaxID=741659 RepID=A0A8J4DQW4_9ACTN|nr:histidine kinase [Virgisporangium aliadipatigenens]GIJ46153.1 two-component sensor histidine kinase [Virgisporangium aliadipatigenens]
MGRAARAAHVAYELGLAMLVCSAATVAAAAPGNLTPALVWAVGLTTLVLIPLRLRHPVAVFVAGAVVGLCTGGENSLVLLVLSASAGYRAARWRPLCAAFGFGWLCWVVAAWLWEGRPGPIDLVVLSALFALFGVVPAIVGRMVRRRRAVVASMHRRNVDLHGRQAEVARRAQIRERARIARDLHDSLGHKLTLISLYTGTLPTADEEQRAETAALLREASTSAMAELRQILGILREDDDGAGPVGGLDDLDDLAGTARATGADVRVTRDGEPRPLPALTTHAAYRVVQEGLTNALRHAHGAAVRVVLRYESSTLTAEVVNGRGDERAAQSSGQGLFGLAERVRLAGGSLYHGPTPEGGYRLAAMLPYPDSRTGAADEPAPQPPPGDSGDFAELVARGKRRSLLGLAAAAVGAVSVTVLCGVGVAFPEWMGAVDPDTFEAVHPGDTEKTVRAALPPASWAETGAAGGSPVPEGASCVDYSAALLTQLREGSLVYRFCFRDGVLVHKQAFQDGGNGT